MREVIALLLLADIGLVVLNYIHERKIKELDADVDALVHIVIGKNIKEFMKDLGMLSDEEGGRNAEHCDDR